MGEGERSALVGKVETVRPESRRLSLSHQLPQHKWQDAAVLVIIDLDGRIDPANDGNDFRMAVRAGDAQTEILLGLEIRFQADHVVNLAPEQSQSLGAGS